jgi:hypothetical protein
VSALATSYCNLLAKCSSQGLALEFGDAATCQTDFGQIENQILALPGVTVTGAQLDACAAKLNALTCNQAPTAFQECSFAGSLAANAVCADGSQCASSYCKPNPVVPGSGSTSDAESPSAIKCGHCVDRADAGGACDDDDACKPGLVCQITESKCAVPPARGAACTSSGPSCAGGLACVKSVCADALPAGAACEGGSECATGLDCTAGKCTDAGSHIGTAQLGQPCGVDLAAEKITVCITASCTGAPSAQKCVPYAKEGEDCGGTNSTDRDKPSCALLLTCDPATKKCQKPDFTQCK